MTMAGRKEHSSPKCARWDEAKEGKKESNQSEDEKMRQEGENLNEHSDNVEAIKTIN